MLGLTLQDCQQRCSQLVPQHREKATFLPSTVVCARALHKAKRTTC